MTCGFFRAAARDQSVDFVIRVSISRFGGWIIAKSLSKGSKSLKTIGEFDPGSGRTLAACLTHASHGGPQG